MPVEIHEPPYLVGGNPKPLVAGATFMYVTYNGYGWSVLNGVAKRMRGARELSIYGSMRNWNGKAGTNWNTGDNWEGGAVPEEGDTAYIPVSAPNMPQLSDTVSIEAVTVENGATISMGSYNLKVTMDVVTGTTGGITSTTGTLVLRGTSKFVRGVVPRTSITGTYSLSGDLSAHAPLAVNDGRLTDSGYTLTITNE